MAKYTLSIETDDSHELNSIVARLASHTSETQAQPVLESEAVRPTASRTKRQAPAPTAPAEAPAAAAPAPVAAAPTPAPTVAQGEAVGYDQVKEALISLMEKKSASQVQQLLLDAYGVKAISGLTPDKYPAALQSLKDWSLS